jgi:hypothetical protein
LFSILSFYDTLQTIMFEQWWIPNLTKGVYYAR